MDECEAKIHKYMSPLAIFAFRILILAMSTLTLSIRIFWDVFVLTLYLNVHKINVGKRKDVKEYLSFSEHHSNLSRRSQF